MNVKERILDFLDRKGWMLLIAVVGITYMLVGYPDRNNLLTLELVCATIIYVGVTHNSNKLNEETRNLELRPYITAAWKHGTDAEANILVITNSGKTPAVGITCWIKPRVKLGEKKENGEYPVVQDIGSEQTTSIYFKRRAKDDFDLRITYKEMIGNGDYIFERHGYVKKLRGPVLE